jgi:3',5'-cyclic AMP phosphodiesterase CpdA
VANQGVSDGLKKAIRELKPDYIVISGDFVNKAQEQAFDQAAEYLRRLFLDSGFDLKERVLVVPGNHDVSFFPRKHSDDPQRLQRYKEFLRILFSESDSESRKQRFLFIDSLKKVLFLCLDSTLKDLAPAADGEIGASQIAWIERKMKQAELQIGRSLRQYAKIAVVHHHLVPIAGSGISGERLMQLLDAGDVMAVLQKYSFNIVLHGHKHIPHVKPEFGSDSSVLTVIGAGTTTCRFLEEQHTFGNNFNLIKVEPDLNHFTHQVFRANPAGEFLPAGVEQTFPLFRLQPAGFSAGRMRRTITIESNGTVRVALAKEHLRVERPGTEIRTLPFRVFAHAKGSKILEFWADSTHGKVEKRVDSDTLIEGEFVLKQPLLFGAPEVSQFYSYSIAGGNAMVKADLATMYSDERETEGTTIIITNPIQVLEIELNLPPGLPDYAQTDFRSARERNTRKPVFPHF